MKTKRIHVLTSLTLATVLALTACGQTTSADETVSSTEVMSEATVEEATETIIEETTEADVPETESVEAETETETEVTEETTEIDISEADSANTINAETVSAKTADSYTYTDMEVELYITTDLNVRDLPSTNGDVIGSLAYGDAVIVTGQCNETGWYRIENFRTIGVTGYFSNKYTSDTYPGETQSSSVSSSTTEIAYADTNAKVSGDGYSVGETFTESVTGITGTTDVETPFGTLYGIPTQTVTVDYCDRTTAEYTFQYMNQKRVENGLSPLTWSEELYSYACERANTNDAHISFGAGAYSGIYSSENYATDSGHPDYADFAAESIATGWIDSPGHYANAMNADWTETAVAVRYFGKEGDASYCVIAYQVFR